MPGVGNTVLAYNRDRQVELITRSDGTTIDPQYDFAGRLDHTVTPEGVYDNTYSPTTGHLESTTSPFGPSLSFTYDGSLPIATTFAGPVTGTVRRVYDESLRTEEIARQRAQEARQRAAQFTSLEIVRLSAGTRRLEGEMSFDEALARLTAEQRRVVCREPDAPMRVKGGPGTGKTLAALLRAGFVALRAKAKAEPARIGFFVFNADLGRDIAARMDSYGLGEFLEPSSPQSIVVTSLHDWCTRFVNLFSAHQE